MVRSSAVEYRDAFKFFHLLMISSRIDSTFDVDEWDTLLPELVDTGFVIDFRTMCDHQLFTSASSFPSSEESNAEDGTSGKLTGLAILSSQNVLFR